MKKRMFIQAVVFAALFIGFTACEKNRSAGEEPELQKVTVEGKVKAMLNETLDANAKDNFAPDGTEIIFSINAGLLVKNPIEGYSYKTLTYKAIVKEGKYEIKLDAPLGKSATYNVMPVSFKAEKTTAAGKSAEKKFYQAANELQTVTAGQNYKLDLKYYTQ